MGDEIIHDFAALEPSLGTLRLLSPTECVRDRLTWYYHADDPQGLDQAIWVARLHRVDLRRIAEWSRRERAEDKLVEFERRLGQPDDA